MVELWSVQNATGTEKNAFKVDFDELKQLKCVNYIKIDYRINILPYPFNSLDSIHLLLIEMSLKQCLVNLILILFSLFIYLSIGKICCFACEKRKLKGQWRGIPLCRTFPSRIHWDPHLLLVFWVWRPCRNLTNGLKIANSLNKLRSDFVPLFHC